MNAGGKQLCSALLATFFHPSNFGLFFYAEDGGNIFLRNVG
jgi:hypothetical protein